MPPPRKTEVDEKLAKAICDNLELAMPLSLAAEAEGVSRTTAYRWVDEFPVFAGMVTRARAVGAKHMVARALKGEKGSSMAGWMLERRYHDDYGPPRREDMQPSEVRITIEGGLPARPQVTVDQAAVPENAGKHSVDQAHADDTTPEPS